MPRSLIDSGYADFILRPQDIPEALLKYTSHPYTQRRLSTDAILKREQHHFNEIMAILRSRKRQDFSAYKKPTLMRRIERRMGLVQTTVLGEYAKQLRQNPSEVTALADDFMIHVTGFFRDADAWETLRQQVILPLLAEREPHSS